MIKLVNVNKYFGNLHVLKDVNLEVREGEKLGFYFMTEAEESLSQLRVKS